MKYIKSPLNYVGGKFKLPPQIIALFPDNINTFVDLFGGGGHKGAAGFSSDEMLFKRI